MNIGGLKRHKSSKKSEQVKGNALKDISELIYIGRQGLHELTALRELKKSTDYS